MKVTVFINFILVTAVVASAAAFTASGVRAQDAPFSTGALLSDEGTETELPAASLKSIEAWATNSAVKLSDLLDLVKGMNYTDACRKLTSGIRVIVQTSAPKETESLMRFILNRAIKVNELIANTANLNLPGAIDTQVRILQLSAEMALRYYQSDIAFLNDQKNSADRPKLKKPYSQFAFEYAKMLMDIDKSVFGDRAQYGITRMALGFFHVDLYRDEDFRFKYGPAIGKIAALLGGSSAKPGIPAVPGIPVECPRDPGTAMTYRHEMIKTYEQALAFLATVPVEKK